MSHEWTYLVADLLTGTIGAELPLSGVTMTKVLNDSGTFTGNLQLGKPGSFVGDVFGLTTPARTALYALRDGVPWWGGILWTTRYDSTSSTLQIGGADWWSYFDHRKIVPLLGTVDGPSTVAGWSVTYNEDQNQIARDLVALAQTHTAGNIGMIVDSSSSGLTQNITYDGYSLNALGDALRALTKLKGGPDIRFDVGSPRDGTNRPARLMLVGDPTLAQDGDPLVIEYGGNMISYMWPRDGSAMATRTYAVGSGTEEATPISVNEDVTKYADGWALLEQELPFDTISDSPTLTASAEAATASASRPLAVPTFVVNGDMDPKLGQYAPGWEFRALISDAYFYDNPPNSDALDTLVRLVSISVSPGDGVEQVTLAVNPIGD